MIMAPTVWPTALPTATPAAVVAIWANMLGCWGCCMIGAGGAGAGALAGKLRLGAGDGDDLRCLPILVLSLV